MYTCKLLEMAVVFCKVVPEYYQQTLVLIFHLIPDSKSSTKTRISNVS